MNNLPKLGLPITVLLFVTLIILFRSAVNIGYGEAGVVWKRFGGGTVTDKPALSEGFHIIAPWNKVYVYNIKQQEEFESGMRVLSSNGLEISLDVSGTDGEKAYPHPGFWYLFLMYRLAISTNDSSPV